MTLEEEINSKIILVRKALKLLSETKRLRKDIPDVIKECAKTGDIYLDSTQKIDYTIDTLVKVYEFILHLSIAMENICDNETDAMNRVYSCIINRIPYNKKIEILKAVKENIQTRARPNYISCFELTLDNFSNLLENLEESTLDITKVINNPNFNLTSKNFEIFLNERSIKEEELTECLEFIYNV